MNTQKNKNVYEKFLSIFTEVRAGEGFSATLLFLNIFVLLTSYYMMKTVREGLILSEGSAEIKSYSSAGQVLLLLFAIPLYAKIASKMDRRRLINTVTLFFTACLGLFYILGHLNVPISVIFFLWVGIFNYMIVAQFWAFANDIYTPEGGKRIFIIVAFGQSAGAVVGGFLASQLVDPFGVLQLLLVAGVLLAGTLIFTNIVDTREKKFIKVSNEVDAKELETPIGKEGAFKLVFKSRYLLLLAFLLLFLNWVNTTGEYILSRIVTDAAHGAVSSGQITEKAMDIFIVKFYGEFYTGVNLTGLLLQLFVVSRILKYLGVRIALLILPFIAIGGYGYIALIPILSTVRWIKTAENATDYSLQNTVRQVLFLPTSREEKYKAKQVIDTFFVRAGDVLSALLVYVGITFLSFQTSEFASFNIGLAIIWLMLSFFIGKEYTRLVADKNK